MLSPICSPRMYCFSWQSSIKCRQGPRLTWKVRRENEPLKNRDFNFEGQFLSQHNFWWQKLHRIGISHVWIEDFGHFKKNSFTHLLTAAPCLPSPDLATFPYTWICCKFPANSIEIGLKKYDWKDLSEIQMKMWPDRGGQMGGPRWPNGRKGDRRLLWPSVWKIFFRSG